MKFVVIYYSNSRKLTQMEMVVLGLGSIYGTPNFQARHLYPSLSLLRRSYRALQMRHQRLRMVLNAQGYTFSTWWSSLTVQCCSERARLLPLRVKRAQVL